MKIKNLILVLAILLSRPVRAQESNDEIVMKNGDHFRGEIKGLDSGVLSVKLRYVDGDLKIQWSQVASLKSDRLFVIRTETGRVYTGLLTTLATVGEHPAELQVDHLADAEVKVPQRQVIQLNQASERFWHRFDGGIDTGILYSKANQTVQYNVDSQLAYRRERWSSEASVNSTLASNSGLDFSTRNQIEANALHFLGRNNWFYAGSSSFLQSSVQEIDLQTTIGAGVGRYLKNSPHASISLLGGLAWQSISYEYNPEEQKRQNTAVVFVETKIKTFTFKKTSLEVSASVLPAVTDPGRVHFNTNAAYYVKLIQDLSWNVSFYGSWDNHPPPTFSGSDYGASSGLSWTFGNR